MSGSNGFTPSRLRTARRRRRLTITEFARRIGKTPQMVVRYEKGKGAPSPETLAQIATTLDFAEQFFGRDDLEIAGPDVASFRALTSMSARDRDAALAAATIAVEVIATLDETFELPKLDIPDLFGVNPEEAAALIRQRWGYDLAEPLPNIVQLLEAHGVRVFSLVHDARSVGAFALWHEGSPFVFLNTTRTPERGRFDAAHELGHLVLHQREKPQGRQAEHEADAFAAALLMPREGVIASAASDFSLDDACRDKAHWRVSAVAYVKRLHTLALLSDWDYREAFIKMSARGWRTDEPPPCLERRETTALFVSLREGLADQGGFRAMAKEIGVPARELSDLIFGIAPADAVDAAGASADRDEDQIDEPLPSLDQDFEDEGDDDTGESEEARVAPQVLPRLQLLR